MPIPTRRVVRFADYFKKSFGGLPNLYSLVQGKVLEAPEGFRQYGGFEDRYAHANAISVAIDGFGTNPLAAGLRQKEMGVRNQLIEALRQAAEAFEWDCNPCGFYWGRSTARKAALQAAIDTANAIVTSIYPNEIEPQIHPIRAAINAQEAAAAKAAAEAATAKAAAEETTRRIAEEKALIAEKARIEAQKATVVQQIDLEKAAASAQIQNLKVQSVLAKAAAPKLAGFTYEQIGLGLGATLGLWTYAYFSKSNKRKQK